MEIHKYKKDEAAIQRRRNLPKFGSAQEMKIIEKIEDFKFKKISNDVVEEEESEEFNEEVYIPSYTVKLKADTKDTEDDTYIAPTRKLVRESCSVKISNYTLDLKKDELLKIIRNYTNVRFGRFNMVCDRETGMSRGYSFIEVGSKEDALQLINDLKVVIIDNLRLCVEMAKNKIN